MWKNLQFIDYRKRVPEGILNYYYYYYWDPKLLFQISNSKFQTIEGYYNRTKFTYILTKWFYNEKLHLLTFWNIRNGNFEIIFYSYKNWENAQKRHTQQFTPLFYIHIWCYRKIIARHHFGFTIAKRLRNDLSVIILRIHGASNCCKCVILFCLTCVNG